LISLFNEADCYIRKVLSNEMFIVMLQTEAFDYIKYKNININKLVQSDAPLIYRSIRDNSHISTVLLKTSHKHNRLQHFRQKDNN
jgi:hypothetical protein